MEKRVLRPQQLRRVPRQFSWVDQGLMQHFECCSVSAWGLYLFLVVVGDRQGLSYYSDASVGRALGVSCEALGHLRAELEAAGVLAYCRPLYQVLSLETAALRSKMPQPIAAADVLRAITGTQKR